MTWGKKTGGRQKGSKNKPKLPVVKTVMEQRAEAATERLVADPPTMLPLEAMLRNMEWAWGKAAEHLERIMKHPDMPPESQLEAFKELVRLRDRVQHYAEKAAPYCHPKLHAVTQAPKAEEINPLMEIDPIREHIKEMAKIFRLKVVEHAKG